MERAAGRQEAGVELIAGCADSTGMYSSTRGVSEPRKAMMAVAKVTWEDQNETVHTAPARIEDTSPSGACLRTKVPIEAGTRVQVSWCRDEFSGTTKWCRAADGEYVMGMQRDEVASRAPARTVQRVQAASGREAEMRSASAPAVENVESIPRQRQVIRRGTLRPVPGPEPLPLVRVTFPAAVIREPVIGFEIANRLTAHEAAAGERMESSAARQKRTTSLFEERTAMPNKWLNLGARKQNQEGANGNGNSAAEASGASHISAGMAGDATMATPRADLLLLEDIYRTAGVMEPRMGYSINKVVEMLKSDHLRGLGDEVKRASVLMALNAAGIPLGDIMQDAAQRQSAVAAYESEQRKKFEEYWSRRAEENTLLQAEMERVTRQYVERMNRNLTEVQQEKEAFQKWQSAMQHEVLQISEAATLCAQPAVYESSNEQPASGGGGQSLVAKSA